MIKKLLTLTIASVAISGITSCVSNDYEDDFVNIQEKATKKDKNAVSNDTIINFQTTTLSVDGTEDMEDDGDREKWGNTKIN